MDFAEPPQKVSGELHWSRWGTGDRLKKAIGNPELAETRGALSREGLWAFLF